MPALDEKVGEHVDGPSVCRPGGNSRSCKASPASMVTGSDRALGVGHTSDATPGTELAVGWRRGGRGCRRCPAARRPCPGSADAPVSLGAKAANDHVLRPVGASRTAVTRSGRNRWALSWHAVPQRPPSVDPLEVGNHLGWRVQWCAIERVRHIVVGRWPHVGDHRRHVELLDLLSRLSHGFSVLPVGSRLPRTRRLIVDFVKEGEDLLGSVEASPVAGGLVRRRRSGVRCRRSPWRCARGAQASACPAVRRSRRRPGGHLPRGSGRRRSAWLPRWRGRGGRSPFAPGRRRRAAGRHEGGEGRGGGRQ